MKSVQVWTTTRWVARIRGQHRRSLRIWTTPRKWNRDARIYSRLSSATQAFHCSCSHSTPVIPDSQRSNLTSLICIRLNWTLHREDIILHLIWEQTLGKCGKLVLNFMLMIMKNFSESNKYKYTLINCSLNWKINHYHNKLHPILLVGWNLDHLNTQSQINK